MVRLEDWRIASDEDADTIVAAIKRRDGINRLEDLLVELFHWGLPSAPAQPVLPGEILGFLNAAPPPPDWFPSGAEGWERIARAQALYAGSRHVAMVILGCASLPYCYAHREVAGNLIMSGRLASQVRRRLGETANFVDTVMKPGALTGGGDGMLWARKVRLIHAVMRALILEDPANFEHRTDGRVSDVLLKRRWEYADRQPINQVDLAFVLLTFSHVVLKGWRDLGVSVTAQQSKDYLFTWAFIGHLLGIAPPLLRECMDRSKAEAFFNEIIASHRPADDSREAINGRLLCAALLVLLRERVVHTLPEHRWFSDSFARSLMRWLLGTDTANYLWVEPAPLFPRLLHKVVIGFGGVVKLGKDIEQTFGHPAPRFVPSVALAGAKSLGHADKP